MWVWVILGGAAGGLVLLVVWSCLVVGQRADEVMERLMAASMPGAPKIPGGE